MLTDDFFDEDYDDGKLPWERGHYGTVDAKELGLPFSDAHYEVIGEGCYRRLPSEPGSE